MPRKKKVEEEVKNEVIKGTEVSEETVSESTQKEMSLDEQYDLAKKALVIKAYNVLTKIEDFVDMVMAFTPNEDMAKSLAALADNLKDEDFRDKLIDKIVEGKGKDE